MARKPIDVFETYNRFAEGRKVPEKKWDYEIIPQNVKLMKERYEISFGNNFIPEDQDLVDRLFIAGVDMLLTTGIFNSDLGTVFTIEEDELYEGLKMAPKKLKLGHGKDRVSCKARRGNTIRKPVIQGGPTGAPVSESVFTQMIEAYAQEPVVDTIVSGVLNTIDGHPATTKTPWEIKTTMAEIRYVREATRRAGRPGMCIYGPQTPLTATGRLTSSLGDEGLKWFDSHKCSQLNELKMDMTGLNMLAGWHSAGDIIMIEQMPIMGGYSGDVEETAICDIATTIASFALFNCDIHLDGPIHIRWGITSTRQTLQVAGHVAAALDYNTDLLLGNKYYTLAGPCTEMCLLETAAQALVDTASGRELLSGVAAAKGTVQDKTTGMEARIMGEASMAACGMNVQDINRIVENIVSRYEGMFISPPLGKKFQECYNMSNLLPNDEYISVYDHILEVLSQCGIDF